MGTHQIVLKVSDEQLAELTKYVTNMQPEYKVVNPLKLLELMIEKDIQDVVGYLLTKTHEGLQNVIGSCLDKKDCVMDGFVEEVERKSNSKVLKDSEKFIMLSPSDFSKKHEASQALVDYMGQFSTLDEAWERCERSDWMIWMLEKAKIQGFHKELRLFACKCAEMIKQGSRVGRDAIIVAKRYAEGEATLSELNQAYKEVWYSEVDVIGPNTELAAKAAARATTNLFAIEAAREALKNANLATFGTCKNTSIVYNTVLLAQADMLRVLIPNPFK